jgi:hypothetical protein
MGLRVRSASDAASKFANRGAAAAGDYKNGLAGSGQAWQQNTSAAADNYAAGVQAAIGRQAFSKGVNKSGGAYFEQRATAIGANRYADGVRNGQQNYQDGVAASFDALSKLTLTPRGPKGDPRNMQRAQEVAQALRAVKVGS